MDRTSRLLVAKIVALSASIGIAACLAFVSCLQSRDQGAEEATPAAAPPESLYTPQEKTELPKKVSQ